MFRQNQGEKEHCTFCGKDGHNEDGCFRLIGYPDWWPEKGRQEKQRPRTVHVEGGVMADIRDHRSTISTAHQSARGQRAPIQPKLQHLDLFKGTPLNSKVFCNSCMKAKFARLPFPVKEEEIFIPPSIWVDEVIEEKRKDLNGEPNETEIGHEVDVGPERSQDEDNQFGPTEEPTFNSDSNNFVETAKRNRTRPTYLDDYEVPLPQSIDHKQPTSSPESSTVHSLAHYISYDNFTNTHKDFLSAITSNNEPKHFQQAIQDPRWIEAMKKEIQALEQNKTWTLEELPNGKKAIDS
ncbi:putative RNA-directed DNA polymerase [Tanacetum coccineum]